MRHHQRSSFVDHTDSPQSTRPHPYHGRKGAAHLRPQSSHTCCKTGVSPSKGQGSLSGPGSLTESQGTRGAASREPPRSAGGSLVSPPQTEEGNPGRRASKSWPHQPRGTGAGAGDRATGRPEGETARLSPCQRRPEQRAGLEGRTWEQRPHSP